jgi:FixJ family two-component response regulator
MPWREDATVFVVDADPATCDAIRNLVDTMNLRCEVFDSGLAFLEGDAASRPGCVILEIRIPGISGLEIQERLVQQGTTLPVIFLTTQATVSMAVRAMRAGAIHFLEKPFREHELWDTIREAVQIDFARRDSLAQRHRYRLPLTQLTAKERRMLEMIACGHSKKDMAEELEVCLRTVELRRNQLMKKLGCNSLLDLMHFAIAASEKEPAAEHAAGFFPGAQECLRGLGAVLGKKYGGHAYLGGR